MKTYLFILGFSLSGFALIVRSAPVGTELPAVTKHINKHVAAQAANLQSVLKLTPDQTVQITAILQQKYLQELANARDKTITLKDREPLRKALVAASRAKIIALLTDAQQPYFHHKYLSDL